jgi:hypothetical protein
MVFVFTGIRKIKSTWDVDFYNEEVINFKKLAMTSTCNLQETHCTNKNWYKVYN